MTPSLPEQSKDQPVIKLPPRLDSACSHALREIIAHSPAAVLDGTDVTYLGGLCLQVLLASARPIVNPSEKLSDAFVLFGASMPPAATGINTSELMT